MAQSLRNDPSSISFGKRLSKAEHDTANAWIELNQLKKALPNSRSLEGAAMAADVIKQQRKCAKQMLVDHSTSLEDINSIDPSVLTPAYREQLRLNKRDAAMRELAPEAPTFAFDDQALQRFENWRQDEALRPKDQQAFAETNFTPEQLTPFQRWNQRQKSLAGRQWNAQQRQAEYQRDLMFARRENQLKRQHKPKGRTIGGIKPLNDEG